MKIKAAVIAIALTVPGIACAHDFWLMPRDFQVDRPSGIRVFFNIGHDSRPEPWNLRADKVVALRVHGPRAVVDLRSAVVPRTATTTGFAAVPLSEVGTHMVAFESTRSVSDLPAARFNEYVAEEGLTGVAAHRAATGATNRNGRETYSRRAKAFIQVGDKVTDQVLEPVGHTLEIVPEKHPYALGTDGRLPVRVYFRGKPLAGALVRQTDLNGNARSVAKTVTDREGLATFTVPGRSAWRLNVIWSEPVTGNSQAEFDTIFTSLTFGYRAP